MGDKVIIEELDPTTQELLSALFEGYRFRAPSSDTSYLVPIGYKEDADRNRNMPVRADDVWVTGIPRSGTTLTQELVWQIKNDCDFVTASEIPLMDRYMFIEGKHSVNLIKGKTNKQVTETVYSYEEITNALSPRFIKTHLPFSLLPPNLLDIAKVVYVARDPRDVAVSQYQIFKLLLNYDGDFKKYWNLFINDLTMFSPLLAHIKEAWAFRHHPNMMFVFYEDVRKDLSLSIKRIADFLGKEITDEQVMKLCEHLNIKNFRKNESVNPAWMAKIGNPDAEGFIRKGKAGGWREHFDEEMMAQAHRWMQKNLADCDLRFPESSAE